MHRYHRFLVQGDNKLTKSLLSLFYLTRFPHLAHLQHFYFNISTSFPGPKHERSLVVYCVINTCLANSMIQIFSTEANFFVRQQFTTTVMPLEFQHQSPFRRLTKKHTLIFKPHQGFPASLRNPDFSSVDRFP